MQTSATRWRPAFRRLVTIAKNAGEPVVCSLPQRSTDEIDQHLVYIETRYGAPLPPSFRSFLEECDGCTNLFRGAALFSLGQLVDPSEAGAADEALAGLNTPIPSFVSPVQPHWRDQNLICIGMDGAAQIVFVLDPGSRRSDGEMDVIAWISGLGVRLSSFTHLLEFLGDLMEASGQTQHESQTAVEAFIAA